MFHRDIKPANGMQLSQTLRDILFLPPIVFLTSQCQTDIKAVKLGDFGLSQILRDGGPPSTYVGTYQYMPPVWLLVIKDILGGADTRAENQQTAWSKDFLDDTV